MHYRFPPQRIFAGVAGTGGAVAYVGIHLDWLALIGWWPFAVIGGLLLFSAGYWIWDSTADERHTRAMAKFANVNKWDYSGETRAFVWKLGSFPFDQGDNRRDTCAISGVYNKRRCWSFTREYEIGTDKNRRTERWQIDLVELQYPLKTVDIIPDDALAKFAKSLGGMDIDFESAAFNRRWRVMSKDLKFAHDVVHPRMMERLLKDDARGLAIRIEGPAVMCWQFARQGPEDLARRLGVLTAIAKLIPDFLMREYEFEHRKELEAQRKREAGAPKWATTPYALTSGKYTGIGAENYPEVEPGKEPEPPLRDDEDRAW